MEIYKKLLISLDCFENLIKKEKYNDKYLKQHVDWQFEYLNLIDKLDIPKQELTENRTKIHSITKLLYGSLKNKMVHPIYTNYIGYKNGNMYNKNTKIFLKNKEKPSGYIENFINKKNLKRHRFILECFFQRTIDCKYDVDHIDNNKCNNFLDNLQILTKKEHGQKTRANSNQSYKDVAINTRKPLMKFKLNTNNKKIDVTKYKSLSNAVDEISKTSESEKRSIKGYISKAARGNLKTFLGFHWEYVIPKIDTKYKNEKWKSLTDVDFGKFKGCRTEISDFGRTRSASGVISFGVKQKSGYYSMCINCKRYYVHVIVAHAFIGQKPSEKHTVDHIDRNPSNNKIDNLRWVDTFEQANNSTAKAIIAHKDNKFIGFYVSQSEAERKLNLSGGTVSRCIKNKTKTIDGYTFKSATSGDIKKYKK